MNPDHILVWIIIAHFIFFYSDYFNQIIYTLSYGIFDSFLCMLIIMKSQLFKIRFNLKSVKLLAVILSIVALLF